MAQRTMNKGLRYIIVAGLTVALALSANLAWAGHQLVEEGSASLELEPTQLAGNATGQIKLQIGPGGNDCSESQGGSGGQAPGGGSQPDDDSTTEPDGDDSSPPPEEDPDPNGDLDPNGDPDPHGNGPNDMPPNHMPQNHPENQRLGLHGTNELVDGQTVVTGCIRIQNLENTENVEAFLVDEDGNQVKSLGRLEVASDSTLEKGFSITVDDVKNFDSVVVTRQPADGNNEDPSSEILFSADLSHDE